jgi:hypothetical protein
LANPQATPLEPWFFEVETPFDLTEDEADKVKTLEAFGRELVRRMVEHIALDEGMPLESVTPGFADHAINRARDAIHAARNAGPRHRAIDDLEELAGKYMQTMRLWLAIQGAARDRAH